MTITIQNTSKIVRLNGIDCRMWEGQTGRGVPVVAFIPRVAVRDDQDGAEFEADLKEERAPSAETAQFPLSMIL